MSARYVAGCAGQFAIGQHHGYYYDEDEAIAACDTGPVGCEVYDRLMQKWIGPSSKEELDAAKARVEARA